MLTYGALFSVWSAVLIGAVHGSTARYLSHVVDQILEQRLHYLTTIDRSRLPELMAASGELDLRDVMSYGLFDAQDRYLSGNMVRPPAALRTDGLVHGLPKGVQRHGRAQNLPARGVAVRLDNGELLVLARDTSVIDRAGVVIRSTLFWALSLTLIPGVIGGYLLSRGPLRRVREIEKAVQPIMRGNLGGRLPVSQRGDELDLLAGIVNTMLVELERLVGEVKGVCDSIAHDLRTPLTRTRAQLHRLRCRAGDDPDSLALIEQCTTDIDALLARFRALLRISELEDIRRRAGFAPIDLNAVLREVHELYAPLAEDKNVQLRLDGAPLPAIEADRGLMFEACSNLVSNAIKFTPAGGRVDVRTIDDTTGPRIEVLDTGPGIPASERDAVLQRFYRSDAGRQQPGFGLGLSIVLAIVRLHGFRLDIGDSAPRGARVTLHCAPAPQHSA